MSDSSGRMTSSLALVEKKNQRPGGCVGIFFQLFDWNRKFAKEKLFSKKLLPPVRLKKASKMFGGDETQPKLRLITNENSGGFPCMKHNEGVGSVKSEVKREMQTPGLVARLMGLESMPAVQRDKLKKVSSCGTRKDEAKKYVDKNEVQERREFCVGESETKNELRPQKLQKTGSSDRRPVSKLEEALQLKNVLAKSRKHHAKLVSPVRSPRNLSGKNSSRLIGAATRILEPGLQRNRSKCLLDNEGSEQNMPITKGLTGACCSSMDILQNSNEQSSSYRNCGHSRDTMDTTPHPEGQQQVLSSMSRNIDHSCEVFESRNTGESVFCSVMGKGNNNWNTQHSASLSVENGQPCPEFKVKQVFSVAEGQRQQRATNTECNSWKNESSSCGLKHDLHGQPQIFKGRETFPSSLKSSKLQNSRVLPTANVPNEARSYIAVNRNSGHARSRVPCKIDDCELRKIGHIGHASPPHVRKRRSDNISGKIESPGLVDSSFSRPVYARPKVMSRRDSNGSRKSTHLRATVNGHIRKSLSPAVSVNTQIKQQNTGIEAEVDEKVYKKSNSRDFAPRKSALQEDDGTEIKNEYVPLDHDSLGAFLQQKLRELTDQGEENASGCGDTRGRKTTAVILQELISGLTGGRLCHHDCLADELQKSPSYSFDGVQSKVTAPADCLEPEYFSPESVLDGTFSSESFVSSSLDDSSKFREETVLLLESNADPLVCATSSHMENSFREPVSILMRNISEALGSIDSTDILLRGSKLAHAKEVILNAEMVFGNAVLPGMISNEGFSICNFVQNELETVAGLMWTRLGGLMGFSSTKEPNELKGVVFDCMIEYLDSRFGRYSKTGFNSWTRLPLRMKTNMLICEILEEVGRWIYMSELIPDELIEHDMSHSSGKWIEFDLEAFETGVAIERLTLDELMDELIVDVVGGRRTSSNSM